MPSTLLSLVLVLLSFGSFAVNGLLQTRYIDDQTGDSVTGAQVTYSPADQWSQGNICSGCNIRPDNSSFNGTWHDTTHFKGDTPRSVAFSFTGIALSVFCIIPSKDVQAVKNYDLQFTLDGAPVGNDFSFEPQSSQYEYNIAVISLSNLTNTEHQFLMQAASTTIDSVILFDYATYVHDDNIPSTTSPSTASPTISRSSSKSNRTVAIVAGVLGGLLFLVLSGIAIFLFNGWRRKNARPNLDTASIVEPFTARSPHPSPTGISHSRSLSSGGVSEMTSAGISQTMRYTTTGSSGSNAWHSPPPTSITFPPTTRQIPRMKRSAPELRQSIKGPPPSYYDANA